MTGTRREEINDHFLRFYTISGASHILPQINISTMNIMSEEAEAPKTYIKNQDSLPPLANQSFLKKRRFLELDLALA